MSLPEKKTRARNHSTEVGPAPPRVKLIAAVLVRAEESLTACRKALEERFGPTDGATEPFLFLFSDFYQEEMGPDLRKVLWSFDSLRDAGQMVEIKRQAVQIEESNRVEGKGGRRLNIDPGFLSADRFVLTSRKDAGHRIFLDSGVFAEVTLMFSRGRYRPLSWTYPDYRMEMVGGFLRQVRTRFLRQMRDS